MRRVALSLAVCYFSATTDYNSWGGVSAALIEPAPETPNNQLVVQDASKELCNSQSATVVFGSKERDADLQQSQRVVEVVPTWGGLSEKEVVTMVPRKQPALEKTDRWREIAQFALTDFMSTKQHVQENPAPLQIGSSANVAEMETAMMLRARKEDVAVLRAGPTFNRLAKEVFFEITAAALKESGQPELADPTFAGVVSAYPMLGILQIVEKQPMIQQSPAGLGRRAIGAALTMPATDSLTQPVADALISTLELFTQDVVDTVREAVKNEARLKKFAPSALAELRALANGGKEELSEEARNVLNDLCEVVDREVGAVTIGMMETMWEIQRSIMESVAYVDGTSGMYASQMAAIAVSSQVRKMVTDLGNQLNETITPVYLILANEFNKADEQSRDTSAGIDSGYMPFLMVRLFEQMAFQLDVRSQMLSSWVIDRDQERGKREIANLDEVFEDANKYDESKPPSPDFQFQLTQVGGLVFSHFNFHRDAEGEFRFAPTSISSATHIAEQYRQRTTLTFVDRTTLAFQYMTQLGGVLAWALARNAAAGITYTAYILSFFGGIGSIAAVVMVAAPAIGGIGSVCCCYKGAKRTVCIAGKGATKAIKQSAKIVSGNKSQLAVQPRPAVDQAAKQRQEAEAATRQRRERQASQKREEERRQEAARQRDAERQRRIEQERAAQVEQERNERLEREYQEQQEADRLEEDSQLVKRLDAGASHRVAVPPSPAAFVQRKKKRAARPKPIKRDEVDIELEMLTELFKGL